MNAPIMSILTVIISLSLAGLLFSIVITQIMHDLYGSSSQDSFREDEDLFEESNDLDRQNDKYMSSYAALFSIILFIISYELFMKQTFEFLDLQQQKMGLETIPFFIAIAALGSSMTHWVYKTTLGNPMQIRKIRKSRTRAMVILLLTFLAFSIGYAFLFEEMNSDFNIIKGATLSLSQGILFYLIFGTKLNVKALLDNNNTPD